MRSDEPKRPLSQLLGVSEQQGIGIHCLEKVYAFQAQVSVFFYLEHREDFLKLLNTPTVEVNQVLNM
jgi:hypothetical protein